MAADHLTRNGYRILERNVRSRLGEIDIVALDGTCIVFVEVRTVRSVTISPEESVGRIKQRRIIALSHQYLQAHHQTDAEWRADVIAIEMGIDGKARRLEHIVNAIEEA